MSAVRRRSDELRTCSGSPLSALCLDEAERPSKPRSTTISFGVFKKDSKILLVFQKRLVVNIITRRGILLGPGSILQNRPDNLKGDRKLYSGNAPVLKQQCSRQRAIQNKTAELCIRRCFEFVVFTSR